MFTYGKSKFNNRKVETAEGTFDSVGEWKRWVVLREAEKAGLIKDLERQVRFTLIPTQYRTETVHLKTKDKQVRRVAEREITYTADFVYKKKGEPLDTPAGEAEVWHRVVEDFKGFANDRWKLKKAMMLYFHGIAVREIHKPGEAI